jgi:hypothetical protein
MEHLQRYLQAQWVVENPDRYDERDVIDAKKYCDAYMDGYNHVVNAYNQARLSDIEQQKQQLKAYTRWLNDKLRSEEELDWLINEYINDLMANE